MKKIIIISVEFLFLLGLFSPSIITRAATGTIYYVDKTNPACSESGSGTNPSQPFCTINEGASRALPGDIVRVLAGTYAEKVKPQNNGTPGNPITFSAAPGVTVTGDGSASGSAFRLTGYSYITIDGFNVTGTSEDGIYVNTSDHIIISNNHVSYAGIPNIPGSERCGIYLSTTTYSTVTGNVTDHNSLDGIRLINLSNNNIVSNNISYANSSQYTRQAEGINLYYNSTSNTIIHNIVYANEDSGLNFYTSSSSNLIIGNVSYGNGDHGIDNNDSPFNIIIGNTIQGNVTSGINLESSSPFPPGSGGAILMNNILVDNGYCRLAAGGTLADEFKGNIRVDSYSTNGTNLDYNLYYLTSGGTQIRWASTPWTSVSEFSSLIGQESRGLMSNPLFTYAAPIAERPVGPPWNMPVNPGNYYIQEGSPAIDSANSNAPNEPDFDIFGRPRMDDPSVVDTGVGIRTYDDRGAYEFFPNLHQLMLPLIER
jgi:parallel beta-helix repeat protein